MYAEITMQPENCILKSLPVISFFLPVLLQPLTQTPSPEQRTEGTNEGEQEQGWVRLAGAGKAIRGEET